MKPTYVLATLGILCFVGNAEAAMTFDQCAALNKGETASYIQTYVAADKRQYKTFLDIGEQVVVERSENANARFVSEKPYGLIMPNSSGKSKTERATGQVESMDVEADFGTDLATILATPGSTVYERNVRARQNDGKWNSAPVGKVQITISDNPPVVIGGCSVNTKVIEVALARNDGSFGEASTRLIYAPSAKLTIKWLEVRSNLLMRELINIEPKP